MASYEDLQNFEQAFIEICAATGYLYDPMMGIEEEDPYEYRIEIEEGRAGRTIGVMKMLNLINLLNNAVQKDMNILVVKYSGSERKV